MPVAKGAVIGFSDVHTRIHIYRAIIEGINFALMDGLKLLEKQSGHKFLEIYVGGGGAQSDEICQITADMFGLPVIRTQTFEVSGIGSAIAAFVGMGEFTDYEEAVGSMVFKKISFPRICSSIRYTIRCMKKFSEIFTDACLRCTSV